MRVIIVDVPISSIWENEKDWSFLKRRVRSSAEQPTAARAAKNCPVMEKAHPTTAMPTSRRHMSTMNL